MNDDFFIRKFPTVALDKKRIKCLFLKRMAFIYEEEVRLVLYSKTDRPEDDVRIIYADPNDIIDTIFLDPSIDKKTEELHIMTLSKLGFKNTVTKSKLYDYRPVWYKTKD